jgi:hypothetical protein
MTAAKFASPRDQVNATPGGTERVVEGGTVLPNLVARITGTSGTRAIVVTVKSSDDPISGVTVSWGDGTGDGTTDAQGQASHTYGTDGTKTVTVSKTNYDSDTAKKKVPLP